MLFPVICSKVSGFLLHYLCDSLGLSLKNCIETESGLSCPVEGELRPLVCPEGQVCFCYVATIVKVEVTFFPEA